MTKAEQLIYEIRAAYLSRTLASWGGLEGLFLLELIRGLDEAAFAFTMAPNRAQLVRQDSNRHLILLGGASALRPFIETLQASNEGLRWAPTPPEFSALADQHLMNCGRLSMLLRLAALERYGLAESRFFEKKSRLILEVSEEDEHEAADREAVGWLSAQERIRLQAAEARMLAMKGEMASKIDKCASVVAGWSLRYSPDIDTTAYHRDYAGIRAAGTVEADALPGNAWIGGKTFAEWNEVSLTALGWTFHRIACATRLRATHSGLILRNLLTGLASRDEVLRLWMDAGESPESAGRIVAGLSLDSETALINEQDHEIPLPYYIPVGHDFVLLPIFGGVMNAHAGLVHHLRRKHRKEWDRAVDAREAVFREDLREAFPAPRYILPNHGVRLKREDGSHLTDIDAVVLDTGTGQVLLIQLKWPDIHGRSLSERNSRRANLLKANEWVDRVHGWVDGRTSREIAAEWGLGGGSDRAPEILVIARHAAIFTGEAGYDARATWVTWGRLLQQAVSDQAVVPEDGSPSVDEEPRAMRPRSTRRGETVTHRLPGLTVEVRGRRRSKRPRHSA